MKKMLGFRLRKVAEKYEIAVVCRYCKRWRLNDYCSLIKAFSCFFFFNFTFFITLYCHSHFIIRISSSAFYHLRFSTRHPPSFGPVYRDPRQKINKRAWKITLQRVVRKNIFLQVTVSKLKLKNRSPTLLQRHEPVREIAKTVYIKSCDMIGRARTKTNHIGRDGLKTSKYFAGKKGSHIAMRHLGNKTRNYRNLISHPPTVWQERCKLKTSGYKEPTNGRNCYWRKWPLVSPWMLLIHHLFSDPHSRIVCCQNDTCKLITLPLCKKLARCKKPDKKLLYCSTVRL